MVDVSEEDCEFGMFEHDVESLCDSDREELENALYSQIHFQANPDSTENPDVLFDASEQCFTSTTTNDKYCQFNIIQENLRPIVYHHRDTISILSYDVPSHVHSSRKKLDNMVKNSQINKHKLKEITSKHSQCREPTKSVIHKVKHSSKRLVLSAKVDVSSDWKDSKYVMGSKIDKQRVEVKANNLTNYECKKKLAAVNHVIYISDNDVRVPSDNNSVQILSDLPSDNNSVIAVSDSFPDSEKSDSFSDSDSSSMCSKIFDNEKVKGDIMLNVCDKSGSDETESEDVEGDSHSNSPSNESDDDEKWRVSEQDILGSQPESFRYYKYDVVKYLRCRNCKEMGHLSRNCPKPKVIVCYLCGNKDHISKSCTQPLCYNCSKPGHVSTNCTEPQYKWYIKCIRCNMPGHQEENCPDLWRRFHLTITGNVPKRQPIKRNPRTFCCNCGSRNHFGFECTKPPMSSHAQITYPFIVSYEPLSIKRKKKGTKSYFDDDTDNEPVYKKKKVKLVTPKGKSKEERNKKTKPSKSSDWSIDPLKNFKKVMKTFKCEKKKMYPKKKKNEKLLVNLSSFVKSATNSCDDKLFLYTDKKIQKKNKLKNKVIDKKKKRAEAVSKNIKVKGKRKS